MKARWVGAAIEYELFTRDGNLCFANGFSLTDLDEQDAISRLEEQVDAIHAKRSKVGSVPGLRLVPQPELRRECRG